MDCDVSINRHLLRLSFETVKSALRRSTSFTFHLADLLSTALADHYQHSGAHGSLGLQMLAQSCHPPPQYPPGHKRAMTGSASTSRANSPTPGPGSGLAPGTIVNDAGGAFVVSLGGGLDLLPPIPLMEHSTSGLGTNGRSQLNPTNLALNNGSAYSNGVRS